jgi:hypothetical protein
MKLTLTVIVAASMSATALAGQPFFDVRTAYMGGAGVAGQRATAGIQLNPANLALPGPKDTWGLTLPVISAGVADPNDLKSSIDDIQKTNISSINTDISTLQTTGNNIGGNACTGPLALVTAPAAAQCGDPSNPGTQAGESDSNRAMESLGSFAAQLATELRKSDGDQVFGNVGLGTGLAIPGKKFGFGLDVKASAQIVGKTEISSQDLATLDQMSAVFSKGYVTLLDKFLYPQLFDTGLAPSDYQSTSKAAIIGLAVGEVGLSFAHQYALDGGQLLAVGVKPKLLSLRTFDYSQFFNSDGGFKDSDFRDNSTTTQMFNADLGVTLQTAPHWRMAASVENVISKDIKTAGGHTISVEPKVTAGFAFNSRFFNWALDADVNRQTSLGINTDSQIVATGVEFNAWNYIRLGLGFRHNLVAHSVVKDVATAGISTSVLGLNLGLAAYGRAHEAGGALQLSLEY